MYAVPSHLRHLVVVVFRVKPENIQRKDAETVCVALLAVTAHELLANANSQYWLAQSRYNQIQTMFLEVCHGSACFSLAREKNAVGLGKQFCIVCKCRGNAQPFQCIDDRIDIAGIILYDGYVHKCVLVVLPEGFRYAGVMSFSGAILSREGKVDYATAPCPTLMLHGTSDKLVPYKQIKLFNLGFFGGGKLVERFKKFGYSYNMFHFIDYGHEIAGSMYSTLDIQKKFLECNVMQKKMRIIEAWISDPDVWKGSGPQSRKELYGN